MDIKELTALRRQLPRRITFPYYAGREDAWLMAQHLRDDTPVPVWRSGPFGKLLTRPLVRPVVAASGGLLRPGEFHALAYAGQGSDWAGLSRAARVQLDAIYATPWQDFEVTFAAWGSPRGWSWNQTSRWGGNLVVQLGFPADHAALMGRYLKRDARKAFEFDKHPIRTSGRPTLAWARLDVDRNARCVLIEEVQSDWLRFAREEVADLDARNPRARSTRAAAAYEAALRGLYGKVWPRVMLLCLLECVREFLGRCDVYMHQPDAGAVLKHIGARRPPVSLYSALPRSFCFTPTQEAPGFLESPRRGDLARLRRSGAPLFWKMAF